LAGIFGPHKAPAWAYFGGQTGMTLFGLAHLLCAGAMLAGMYLAWRLVRMAYLASVTLYVSAAGLQLTAFAVPLLSHGEGVSAFEGVVFNVMLAIFSAAGYREPVVPGNYIDLDGKLWGR
jgi:hypothetical protein